MPEEGRHEAVLRNEGDYWTLAFGARIVRMKDSKGLRYIHRLLATPHREVHVLDLTHGDPDAVRALKGSPGDALLDARARAGYKTRLGALDAEIEDAERDGDTAMLERARSERDAITAALTAAYGLGGRARRAPDNVERARKAITERVRTTLTRIEGVHPELGRHLRRSIRTGVFCCYEPDVRIDWDLAPAAESSENEGTSPTIRVMIVDDHSLWRRTLRGVLEHDGVTVVAEAATGVEAVTKAQHERPDVLLMDMELPSMRGPEATVAILEHSPETKVLVLSSHDERETVLAAISAGADGYLLKTVDADEIVEAVRRIHRGDAVFPAPVSGMVLSAMRSRERSRRR